MTSHENSQVGACPPLRVATVPPEVSTQGKIVVALLDDHYLFVRGLRLLFSYEDDVVVLPDQPGEVDPHLVGQQATVALLGSRIAASMDQAQRSVLMAQTPPVVLSVMSRPTQQSTKKAVLSGAMGVVSMQSPAEVILTAIRRAAEGGCAPTAMIAAVMDEMLPLASLSPTDRALIAGIHCGQSCQTVAANLGITQQQLLQRFAVLLRQLPTPSSTALTPP